jgi:HPr kinase/phosphorylase
MASETDRAPGRSKVTVAQFLNEGAKKLSLSLVAGNGGLEREIPQPMSYRPGLALTGFLQHFANGRIQLIGLVEYEYLLSLPAETRLARLEALFALKIPCMVFARGQEVFPEAAKLAEQYGVPLMRTPIETKDFIHLSTFVLEDLLSPRVRMHGTMMEVAGVGIFIEGEAGIGKSETALGLIKHGYALVADDLTAFRIDTDGHLMGSACVSTRNYMEVRGIGILDVPAIFGIAALRGEKQVDLVITLKRQSKELDELDRTGEDAMSRVILGIKVPQRVISVAPGRDLVSLVEIAACQYKYKQGGGDAVRDLDAQIKRCHLAISEGRA